MKETRIQMKNYGTALSGRSRAREILLTQNITSEELVVLDFYGVEGINHSFVNEVLSGILRSKASIQVINAPLHSASLIENELMRLRQLFRS